MENFKEFETFDVWLENGIIHFVYKPNVIVTLEVAKQMVEEREKVSNMIRRPILLDVRNLASVELKARKYLATERATHLLSAGAVFLDNPLTRWAGNIFLKIDSPPIPTKLFTNKAAALQWLEQFKNLN